MFSTATRESVAFAKQQFFLAAVSPPALEESGGFLLVCAKVLQNAFGWDSALCL